MAVVDPANSLLPSSNPGGDAEYVLRMPLEAAVRALERASAESRKPSIRVWLSARRVHIWLPFRPYGRTFVGRLEPLAGETRITGQFRIGALPRLQLAFVVVWSVAWLGIGGYVLVVSAAQSGASAAPLAVLVLAPIAVIVAVVLMIRRVAEGSEAELRSFLDHLAGRSAAPSSRAPSFGYVPLGAGALVILLVLNAIDTATGGSYRVAIVGMAIALELGWFAWYLRK